MKRIFFTLILIALLISFVGCGGKQTSVTPITPVPKAQTKIVHIDSDPHGAKVFVDNKFAATTPADVKLALGKHSIIFSKYGYKDDILKNVEVKKDTTEIKGKLEKTVNQSVIRVVRNSVSSTLLHNPKLIFISNDALYISDDKGKTVEKVAVIEKNCEARIYDVSPSLKWIILELDIDTSKDFLYAMNIETLELIKIAEHDWEGGFDEYFEQGSDKLVYGFTAPQAPLDFLAVFNLDTRKNSYLLNSSKNKYEKAFTFDLSSDGKYIAYAGGNVEMFPGNPALYLKNLKTGELKMLVKPFGHNMNGYFKNVSFIDGGKKIFYSEMIGKNSPTHPMTKYFVVDFEGHSKEITEDEASKLVPNGEDVLEAKLKKTLHRNLHIDTVLPKCNKIVFTTLTDPEKLFLCDSNFSHVQNTGIVDPNVINSYGCKFTCQILTETAKAPKSTWYLIDASNNTKINLTELLKMNIDSLVYIGKLSNTLNNSESKKSMNVFIISPADSANKSSFLFERLKAKYNVKIVDEKDISSLPLPKVNMCFITLGDKKLLESELEKKGFKFTVKEVPMGKDKTEALEKMEKKEEKIALMHHPHIRKMHWIRDEQTREVLYGVKMLPNGATDEIEGSSNLNTLTKEDIDSIINWIEETPEGSLGMKDNRPRLLATQASGSWIFKGICTNYKERYPYGKVSYRVQFWKLEDETDNTHDYWAVAYPNYSTIPGRSLYNSGYQTYSAWIDNAVSSSTEALLDWDPTNTVGNTSYSVSIGPSLSWTYSIPNITVSDYSNPLRYALWKIEYAASRNKSPCTRAFSNRPGSEFRTPQGSSFNIEVLFSGAFAYSHWYGWDSTAYCTTALENYTVSP